MANNNKNNVEAGEVSLYKRDERAWRRKYYHDTKAELESKKECELTKRLNSIEAKYILNSLRGYALPSGLYKHVLKEGGIIKIKFSESKEVDWWSL